VNLHLAGNYDEENDEETTQVAIAAKSPESSILYETLYQPNVPHLPRFEAAGVVLEWSCKTRKIAPNPWVSVCLDALSA